MDAEVANTTAESAAEFIDRIEQFCSIALKQARRAGRGRDDYKDGLVYEERKRLFADFIKAAQNYKRCYRCDA